MAKEMVLFRAFIMISNERVLEWFRTIISVLRSVAYISGVLLNVNVKLITLLFIVFFCLRDYDTK